MHKLEWFGKTARKLLLRRKFRTSHDYWKLRYRLGGHSGAGSQDASAVYKANFVNDLIVEKEISSLIDLGCGDGQNAALIAAPNYLGLDISARAIALAERRCKGQGKRFAVINSTYPAPAELALSMDVVYHLTEDDVFDTYLRQLASLASRYIVIYGTDRPIERTAPHVLHRPVAERFTALSNTWRLVDRVPNQTLYGEKWPTKPHFMMFGRLD